MGDLFPNQPSAVSPLCNPAVPCSASLSSPVFLEQNWGRPGLTLDSDIHGRKSSCLYNYIPGHPTPLSSGATMRAVPDTHHTDSLKQPPLLLEALGSVQEWGAQKQALIGPPHVPWHWKQDTEAKCFHQGILAGD